jgi:CRP-like cAMP-binding protein
MFGIFEKYLRQKATFTDAQLELIRTASTTKKLRKWQSILHEGEVWRINCFIASGCMRVYRFDDDGAEHTIRFGIDNWWVSDQESFYAEKPSEYNIEALAASTVITWTKANWEELGATIPSLRTFTEQIMFRGYEAAQRRIFSLISQTAEQKYHEFQNTYPDVFSRVPLHMIASYLGISRETLSRIRKEFTKG